MCSNLNVLGTLNIHVKDAQGLPDRDGLFQGLSRSDPFTSVTAFSYSDASSVSMNTRLIAGDHNPAWDETLSFGCELWKSISIGVLDSDCGPDDLLIPFETFPICSTGRCSVNYTSGSSSLNFDIELIPEGNDCHPNPCLNGGTCTDLTLSLIHI